MMVFCIPVKIIVDHEKCNLCGLCIELCPTSVFSRIGDKVVVNNDKCIECYGCMPLCPVRAISISLEKGSSLERFTKHAESDKQFSMGN
ncbi:MAG: 4Fe-4S binding protein [Desulfurococcaceae archaeon]